MGVAVAVLQHRRGGVTGCSIRLSGSVLWVEGISSLANRGRLLGRSWSRTRTSSVLFLDSSGPDQIWSCESD